MLVILHLSCVPTVFITQKKNCTRNFSSISLFVSSVSNVKINRFPSARLDVQVVDVGPPADWVKINVRETVSSLQEVKELRTSRLYMHSVSLM